MSNFRPTLISFTNSAALSEEQRPLGKEDVRVKENANHLGGLPMRNPFGIESHRHDFLAGGFVVFGICRGR